MGFSSVRRLGVGAVAACLVLTTAGTASADPESEAKDLFQRGRDLRQAGDCAGAVPLFHKAWKVFPSGLGSARNVAECEEQLGHFASSRRAWLDIKRALLTAKEDPKYAGWDKDAEDAAKRLQPKVAVVFVDVIVKSPKGEGPATESSGVEILINGENLGPNLVGTPLERDPGQYKVRVQAPYAEAVTQDVALSAGDSKRLTLRIVQNPPQQAGPTQMVDTGGGKRTAGWVMIGVGGASLVAGFITLAMRGGALSDLQAACGGQPIEDNTVCPKTANAQNASDNGKTFSTLTSVLLPVGGVLAAAGIGLVIWGHNSKEAAPAASPAQGSLTVVPGPARIDAVWRF